MCTLGIQGPSESDTYQLRTCAQRISLCQEGLPFLWRIEVMRVLVQKSYVEVCLPNTFSLGSDGVC